MENKIKVLVVDDSALMRSLISKMIDSQEDMTVVGTAMNGNFALQKIPNLNPDIIILDLEMPEMNGIEFLKEREKRGIKIPVIILSSIAQKGAKITFEAISLGASDFITKPSGSVSHNISDVTHELTSQIRSYTGRRARISKTDFDIKSAAPGKAAVIAEPAPVKLIEVPTSRPRGKVEILAIGISTGGPNALRVLLAELKKDFPVPVVVVQHMPEGFTLEFAKSLNRICELEVVEAQQGDMVVPGRIFIAPGNKQMRIKRKPLADITILDDSPPVNGHRPSAGVLFDSVAEIYGSKALGVIMTGMGKDGSAEIGNIQKAGGFTIAQDEKSSVVFGMPRVAIELGNINKILPLEKMGSFITDFVTS